MNCNHGWEDKDGFPAPCYECLAAEMERLRLTVQIAREAMEEAWRQRDEARRVARDRHCELTQIKRTEGDENLEQQYPWLM